ncbi:MAG: SURF1 family protein [Pseudotabrizicola sp.]|uniref:SURF1 family protein n=1 Tax=Pseudotabrizicola sp. TaxID=2939647 RepID=UPI00273180C6|nr:SURF1 family protein [Pseudotabrizicola sp.]MDP2080888.1 SURF1 family protein [Pseudotabrizicola sp.]MDZ7572710.1 SURF1 family protein [Pseudotabrizicola sp.]
MTRRMIIPLLFGLIGGGILMGFGIWQLQRLTWKEAVLADIEARIVAAPVALPLLADPEADRYLPVTATGRFTGESLDVLVSRKQIGAGVRVVGVFETDGRRVLVDRGFVAQGARDAPRGADATTVVGNLHWPSEVDSFTPPPDTKTGLWFARDVPAMASALTAEPLLLIAREPTAPGIEPLPVDTSGIPNDHLGYAVQWFGLAAVWLGMTAYLLWRIRRRTV